MTQKTAEKIPEELRPRLIVWELAQENVGSLNGSLPLNQHECLLVLDSIARTSKPIVVMRGQSVVSREYFREIIDYGHTLGLKMIIEVQPEEITQEIINRYRNYGLRIFRVILDGRINEDASTRFIQSPLFLTLERAVELLYKNNFEIHFSLTINNCNRRSLAFYLDYAFLKRANGLYCHLNFRKSTHHNPAGIDEFLLNIPAMKERVPNHMYLSPQCVKYVIQVPEEHGKTEPPAEKSAQWMPTCLAGRTFGFIDACGKLYVCPGTEIVAGNLRSNGYDFKSLWRQSETFNQMRSLCRSCSEMRIYAEEIKSQKKFKQLVVQENIRNLP